MPSFQIHIQVPEDVMDNIANERGEAFRPEECSGSDFASIVEDMIEERYGNPGDDITSRGDRLDV